jgi:quinol monooxygenase YgiN
MAYALTAKWTAQDGAEETVYGAIRELIEPSRAEPGCRLYQANRSLDDPRVFLLYEIYDDEDAYKAHGASDHFKQYGHELAVPLLEGRERQFFETIDPA